MIGGQHTGWCLCCYGWHGSHNDNCPVPAACSPRAMADDCGGSAGGQPAAFSEIAAPEFRRDVPAGTVRPRVPLHPQEGSSGPFIQPANARLPFGLSINHYESFN